MKDFIKQKFYGRLLSFLKFKRHKAIKASIASSKKKIWNGPRDSGAIAQKRQTQPSYFLKRLDSYVVSKFVTKPGKPVLHSSSCGPVQDLNHIQQADSLTVRSTRGRAARHDTPFLVPESIDSRTKLSQVEHVDTNVFLLTKKRYKLYSVLFNLICKWPSRKQGNYIKSIQGQKGARAIEAHARKYYTIPYRLSLSRFISNKILNKCGLCPRSKVLLKLRKKLLIRAKRCGKSFSSFSLKLAIRANGATVHSGKQKKELARNFILALESRLDNSLLRLLQFKALYSSKQVDTLRAQKGMALSRRSSSRAGLLLTQPASVKSPWKNYSAGQVKQKINHGHIYLNGKKVKSGNIRLVAGDQAAISGFVPSSTWTQALGGLDWGFRRPNGHFGSGGNAELTLSPALTTWLRLPKTDSKVEMKNDLHVCDYIKNLKIKRFTEIFYITYKNLHLFGQGKVSTLAETTELHVKPFFQMVGYNQSIYLLWPVLCLLAWRAWGPEMLRSILRTSGSENPGSLKKRKQADSQTLWQKNLRSLLTQKKLQAMPKSFVPLTNSEAARTAAGGSAVNTKSIPKGKIHMLDQVNHIYNLNPSWIYAKSLNCYAAVVYGTRKCKWVQLQQRKQSDFYNRVCNKLNFFELELDFFQLAYRHYKGTL